MSLLQFDVVALMDRITQIHHTSEDNLLTEILTKFADVFKDEFRILKDIEATVAVDESVPPRFHKPRQVPFALKEKVEDQLDKQVKKVNSSQFPKVNGKHQL